MNNNIIKNIFTMPFNSNSCKNLTQKSTGFAFLYLFIISIILGTLSSVSLYEEIEIGFKDFQNNFIKECPEFTFTKSGFKFDAKMPLLIESGDKEFITIIDTTGKTNRKILDEYKKGMYIYKDKILHKKNFIETREYDLDNLVEFAPFKKSDIINLMSYYWIVIIVIIIFMLIYLFVANIIESLIISVIGLIGKSSFKPAQSYSIIFRLSIYSLTISIILETILDITGYEIPYYFLIHFAIASFYIIGALKKLSSSNTEKTDPI